MRRKIEVTETCLGLGRGGVRNNTASHNYSLVTGSTSFVVFKALL